MKVLDHHEHQTTAGDVFPLMEIGEQRTEQGAHLGGLRQALAFKALVVLVVLLEDRDVRAVLLITQHEKWKTSVPRREQEIP